MIFLFSSFFLSVSVFFLMPLFSSFDGGFFCCGVLHMGGGKGGRLDKACIIFPLIAELS